MKIKILKLIGLILSDAHLLVNIFWCSAICFYDFVINKWDNSKNQDFHYEHKEFALNSKKIPRRSMRITRFERYKCIMKKLSCYDLLRQGQQNCEIGTKFFSAPNIFDSSSQTFSGTKFFRYRFRDFFPVLNFSDTGSDTFLRYQIFPIPVPRLFSGTNFFRYRFRYHQKNEKFPIPGIPGTGTSNSGPQTAQ